MKGGPVFSQTIKKIREGRERWSPASPSHYAPGSPTPHRARTEPSAVPTDKAEGDISAPPTTPQASDGENNTQFMAAAARPKRKATRPASGARLTVAGAVGSEHWEPSREQASPVSEDEQ